MKLTLISLILLMMSCPCQDSSQSSNRAKEVRLDREFELKVDQQAVIKAEQLKVKFISVVEDSRCPEGVTCIWAGRGRVALQLTLGNKKPDTLELSTDPAGQEKHSNGYYIKLVSLNPYPKSDRPIKAADYILKLYISKKPSAPPNVQ
jgi:hypothetical protein